MQKSLVSTFIAKVNGIVGTMDINRDLNHLAVAGVMEFVYIFELKNNQIIQELQIFGNRTSSVFYSKQGALFAVCFQSLLRFKYYGNYYHHTQTIQGNQFNGLTILLKEKYLLLSVLYNNLYFLNCINNELKIINFSQNSQFRTLSINKSEDLLIAGSSKGIQFIELNNNRIKKKIPKLSVYKLQISNNSQFYTEESYMVLKIRSIQTDKIVRKLISDDKQCSLCQKFTKNDQILILTGSDWKIRVYNLKYGILMIYQQNIGWLCNIQFYDNESTEFYCGSQNGTILKLSSI